MINLGIIGTNWITDQFVQAAHETGKYRLAAVYSRRLDTAQNLVKSMAMSSMRLILIRFSVLNM